MKKLLFNLMASLLVASSVLAAGPTNIKQLVLTGNADAGDYNFTNFGTLGDAATVIVGNGVSITALNASNLGSGTVPVARLGTGGAAGTVLHGNQTFAVVDINSETTGNLSLTRIATIADQRILGNVSGGTAAPIALTQAQSLTFLGTIPVASGGVGQVTYTKGDLLAAPGGASLNKLAVGSDGQILTADAASTNGIKWAAAPSAGVTGSGTSGQIALWTGSGTIGGDAAGLFSSASSVGTLTLGNSANGIVLGGAKLILKSASNSDIELTPQGTGMVDVTVNQLLVPNGSNGAPAIAGRSDPDTGLVFDPAGANSVGISCGGQLEFYVDGFAFFMSHTRFRPLSNNGCSLGETDTRWTYCYARHITQNVRTVTTNTTLDNTYQIVIVNAAGATTQTLPSAVSAYSSCGNSDIYVIKNRGAGTVTVAATAGTVEQTSITTNQAYAYASDGTNWYVY